MNERGQTRRDVLRAAVAGAAGIALGVPGRALAMARTQAVSERADTRRLADDLFVLRLPGEANIVAHTGSGRALLVDGGSPAAADALMRAVAALPHSGPVHTLFNSHWHPEQTGSNARLRQAGATVIAHENTRLWLTTDVTRPWNGERVERLPEAAHPNRTFYTTGTLDGPRSSAIHYGYIPDAAHTDGDLYVFFPEHNVLAVGDAVTGEGWPVIDWVTGGWIGGIVGGLQRLQAMADADTRIVPARGPVLRLTDLQTQYVMYGTIYERLTRLLNTGRGPDEAVAAQPTKEFDATMGQPDEFVRRAFESLWAYLSPDA